MNGVPAPERPCPAPHPHGAVHVPIQSFACSSHWRVLPGDLKRELGAAWQARCRGEQGATQRHIAAKHAAVAWLQANT